MEKWSFSMALLTRRSVLIRVLFICLGFTLFFAFFLGVLPITSPREVCDCPSKVSGCGLEKPAIDNGKLWSPFQLAVIVPFRDRFDELLEFVPHMTNFLNNQHIRHKIFIVNQIDKYRFNRASLINVGFLQTCNESDYVAMHDVDLLPLNPKLKYAYPKDGPFHIASPELHPRYHYKTFVGGILLMTTAHFKMVNGMSNKYWGWGMEDDEFYARIKRAGLNVTRPVDVDTGIHNTFRHIHDRQKRKRDTVKLFNQKEMNRKLDPRSGLSSIQYKIVNFHHLVLNGTSFSVIDVELHCNLSITPWCEYPNENTQKQNKAVAKKAVL